MNIRSPIGSRWAHHAPLMAQIATYAIVGLGVTLAQAATYWLLATQAQWHSQLANLAGYLVAVALGYMLHGRFTFRQAKSSPGGWRTHRRRSVRFVAVSLLSLALNALWVWICVSALKWPEWTPIPAMIFITPAAIFLLNKKWVFQPEPEHP